MDRKPQALTDAGVSRARFTTHFQPKLQAAPVIGITLKSAQGAGSSIAMHELMSQVIKRGKSVIYDPCGEFFQAYSRSQKRASLNCDGSVTWSLLERLRRDLDADCMANGFLAVQSGGWSLREFLEQPGTGCIFILATQDTRAAFAPLHRLLLTVAFGAIANEHEVVHEDKYWFFFDECQTLGDIRLDERVADLRKYGVAIVAGLQCDGEPAAWLSEERAVTFASTFGTRLELLAREREVRQRTHVPPGKWGAVKRLLAWGLPKRRDGAPDEARAPEGRAGRLEFPGAYAACEVDCSSWLDESREGEARTDRFPPVQPLPTPAPPLA